MQDCIVAWICGFKCVVHDYMNDTSNIDFIIAKFLRKKWLAQVALSWS